MKVKEALQVLQEADPEAEMVMPLLEGYAVVRMQAMSVYSTYATRLDGSGKYTDALVTVTFRE